MLNPNDIAIQAQYGFTLLRLGETNEAMPLMSQAIASGYLPSPIVGYGLLPAPISAASWTRPGAMPIRS